MARLTELAGTLMERASAAWTGLTTAREAYGQLEDRDDWKYRTLNGLDPTEQTTLTDQRLIAMRRSARLLYFRNAVGRGIPDMLVSRVFGAGMDWKAVDEGVKKVCDFFAADPDNDLKEFAPQYAKELLVYGELCLPIYLTPTNADVRLGYLHPDRIEDVIWKDGDEKKPLAVVQRRRSTSDPRYLWIIPHPDPAHENRYPPHPALTEEEPEDDETGAPRAQTVPGRDGMPVMLPTGNDGAVLPEIAGLLRNPSEYQVAGYAFYHRQHSLVTGRGRTIYETVKDWAKGVDDFVFGLLRNAILQGYLLFQVVLVGADDKKVEAERKKYATLPKPGSVVVTNEKVEWKPLAANPGGVSAVKELFSSVMRMIGVGVGLPAHEIAADDDVNRSTAKESKSVSINRAKLFQVYVASMLGDWFGYTIDQKVYKGQLPEDVDRSVEILLPELDSTDTVELAATVQGGVTAMVAATGANLVLPSQARAFLAQLMGQEAMDEEEFYRLLAEEKKKEQKVLLDTAPPLGSYLNPGMPGALPPGGNPNTPPKPGSGPVKAPAAPGGNNGKAPAGSGAGKA